MNKTRLIFTATLLGIAGILLFMVTVITVLPDDFLYDMLRMWLRQRTTLSLNGDNFHKTFPLGFVIKRASLKNSSGELLYLDAVQANINPFSFFTGRVQINMRGSLRLGTVESNASLGGKKTIVKIYLKNIELSAIPGLRAIGLTGTGTASGEANFILSRNSCADGSMHIEGSDIELNGLKGVIPLHLQEKVKFSLRTDTRDCRVKLKGLWIDGQGISSKLSGDIILANTITDSTIDLTMEISSSEEAVNRINILKLLSAYKKSGNNYLLRMKGSLGRPQLMQ